MRRGEVWSISGSMHRPPPAVKKSDSNTGFPFRFYRDPQLQLKGPLMLDHRRPATLRLSGDQWPLAAIPDQAAQERRVPW